ncbi:MAG TPA: aminotransferase class III-fold pyridoxal phosphate-dependent enzyme [Steroidobacteraceae bacterium]|jgi:4-aminobutyrate aminotransferase-like enzyme/Ser/Thr protein kinase RdoA (MazF antagonist)
MNDTAPHFTPAEAEGFVRDTFDRVVQASPLPSERDQNFQLKSADGEMFVLKIAKSDEERSTLDFQNAALKHTAQRAPSLALPRVVNAPSGADIVDMIDRRGQAYLARLVTWLDGILFVEAMPRNEELFASLGDALGTLDLAFRGFSHPAMGRTLHWDLKHVEFAHAHFPLLPAEQQPLVRRFMQAWEAVDWKQLRKSVIHGDANDYNILVRDSRVAGFLDFGDMVHSAIVCDVAIAIAYALLDAPEPLAAARTILTAYRRKFPLNEAELASVYPLVVGRLCMSLCYSAYNAREKSGDAYQQVTSAPAWRLLQKLAGVPIELVSDILSGDRKSPESLLANRRRLLGRNLSLSYRTPLHIVRGSMQYLWDADGRQYLDAYNNVPHVGHCHPRVLQAGCEQMAKLNTNTRYLHESVEELAENLIATLPDPLRVCYFVNSGSEANELALRLARAYSGAQDLIVLEAAYHGNTNTLIDISPYKHDGPGGRGAPSWVHVAKLPDVYRGECRRSDPQAGIKYAAGVEHLIAQLRSQGRGLCGYIAESWPSVGGQMALPDGYLSNVYAAVRAAGGVCIADEVQTGYGRLGGSFWGFDAYEVVPDIVVLGKPIGNGHPMGAVVTTPKIAAAFDNGMEFFSTFGGSTVSSAIGLAVLHVVQDEDLQTHALNVGERLLSGLRELQARHALIGDIRGSGLFLGVELVRDRLSLEPATAATAAMVNDMCAKGVLLGSEGAFHSVLKIRPPMPFTLADADRLIGNLDDCLSNYIPR